VVKTERRIQKLTKRQLKKYRLGPMEYLDSQAREMGMKRSQKEKKENGSDAL